MKSKAILCGLGAAAGILAVQARRGEAPNGVTFTLPVRTAAAKTDLGKAERVDTDFSTTSGRYCHLKFKYDSNNNNWECDPAKQSPCDQGLSIPAPGKKIGWRTIGVTVFRKKATSKWYDPVAYICKDNTGGVAMEKRAVSGNSFFIHKLTGNVLMIENNAPVTEAKDNGAPDLDETDAQQPPASAGNGLSEEGRNQNVADINSHEQSRSVQVNEEDDGIEESRDGPNDPLMSGPSGDTEEEVYA